MPIYQKAPEEVQRLAAELLDKYESHHPVRDAGVTVDYLFAFPSEDQNGVPQGDALKCHGVKALGICRIVPLKDRVKGLADAEISIDGEWWSDASDEQRAALLDHELHHLSVKRRGGLPERDDCGRPKLSLRKHDFQVGWFDAIAARHGVHSLERIQAQQIFDNAGQLYWPQIAGEGGGETPNVLVRLDNREIKFPREVLAGGVR
jgi:hypothetical protein